MSHHFRTVDPKAARKFFEKKVAYTCGPAELQDMIQHGEDLNIIDVRAAEDYADGHIPGAANLPQDQWRTFNGLDVNRQNFIYCYNAYCHLGAKACARFAGKGYPVAEMDGGFEAWKESGYELETSPSTTQAA